MTRWAHRLRRPSALLLVIGQASGIAVADHGGRDIAAGAAAAFR